jgi:transcriptional regulator GlxA family with amidase domain
MLASAGLLDDRRATIHWDMLDTFTERFLDVHVERTQITRDGPYITCAGAMSALEMTLELIEHHLGTAPRLDVEALFLHGDQPSEQTPENQSITDLITQRALQIMRENVERPLSLAALSKRLSCQPRTLNRRFHARLGASPGMVYRHMRLSSARKLLESSTMSISEVALRCGYDSPAAMARAIRQYYGMSPSSLRKQSVSLMQINL